MNPFRRCQSFTHTLVFNIRSQILPLVYILSNPFIWSVTYFYATPPLRPVTTHDPFVSWIQSGPPSLVPPEELPPEIFGGFIVRLDGLDPSFTALSFLHP